MKNSRKRKLFEAKSLLTVLFLCLSIVVFAQTKTVKGTVLDERGESIIGASVSVKGTTTGTITDLDGKFTINTKNNDVLTISYVGYIEQSVSVAGQTDLKIILKEDSQVLDEFVVVGYGIQKKSDVTGAMASVTSKELEARPVANAVQAMQGRAAGVDITSNERPGELGKILIRGSRSITAKNDPLYVVDGIPLMSESAIETLNPRDIESIDILKDASATAIYGSRGANGVVLVTTKKGKDGRYTLNYSGTLTVESIHDKSPMMNASDYITWRRWAAYNADLVTNMGDEPSIESDKTIFSRTAGGDATAWNNIMRGWESGTWNGANVINTDWTDFVTQTAITQEHTLSASGGNEKMQSYMSFGYLNNEGTMKGQSYERYTAKMSVDINPTEWLKMGGSINSTWSDQDYGFSTLGAASSSGPGNIYGAASRIFNYALPYDSDGNIISMPGGDDAIMSVINEWNYSTQQRQVFRALGSFYGQLDLGRLIPVVKGLNYRLNFGPDYRNWREGAYIDSKSVNRAGGKSYARLKNRRDFSWTIDNMLTYNNTFGKHNLGLTLLQTASKWNVEESSMAGYGIPQPQNLWNAFGNIDISDTTNKVSIGSGLTERQLASFMVRMNYGFNDRYLLTVSGRWDGASQLAEGNKWKFFSSAALAWRMDQEDFMKDISWIHQFKLRLGVGSTGNAAVDPYSTLGAIQSIYVPFDNNLPAYTTNEPNYTKNQVGMANKNLGWEMTTQYNLGVDFSFLNGRIGGSVDLYTSRTTDLLLNTKIPTLTGYPNIIANIGETKNKGFDITLNTVNVETKDFSWTTNVNAAYSKDEIVELTSGKIDDISNGWFIGKSISVYYDINNAGLWQESDAEEMAKFNANGHKFKAGMVKPVDQNGDYKIDAEDRVILGSKNPLWTLGISNTFSYKGFELSCMMYGRFKYWINSGGEAQLGRYNQRSINYWTPTNTNADYQMPIYSEAGGDAYSSLLGYKKANFLKMRNISLGYTFPKETVKKMGLGNLKAYVQATNPFTIASSVDFLDLDLGGSTYNRGFVFGLDLTF